MSSTRTGTTWRRSATHLSRATLALLAAGCGGSSGSHVFGVDGHIGPLRVDRSDRAAVVRYAGKPDAERSDDPIGYSPYRALGYDCTTRRSDATVQIVYRGPYCRTVFFLDGKTGKLENFFTASRDYSESHGIRVGTSQAVAERLLHLRLHVGCLAALRLQSRAASLSMEFSGGTEKGLSIKGAHVDAFVLHGKQEHDYGVFDCL
jgi:hypothetical protein